MTYRTPTWQCPGDGERGCLTTIPVTRERCRFCARTVALRKAAGRIHSPKIRHLRPSGSMRELPPLLRDGSCRGCGRMPDELGRCECP